jgi:hypothetical protein
MQLAKRVIPLGAALAFAIAAPPASAAPVMDYHYGIGGSYHNLTTRVVSCNQVRGFHGLAMRMMNYVAPRVRYLRDYRFRWGVWTVRTHWYHDPFYVHIEGGNLQIDVRATASDGRVIRFQSAWD